MTYYDYEPSGEGYITLRKRGASGLGIKLNKQMALARYFDLRNTFGMGRVLELKDLQAAIELEFDHYV